MLHRYLLEQYHLSYVRYMRFGRLMKKNPDVLPPSESLNDGQEDGKKLRISHQDSEMFHAT